MLAPGAKKLEVSHKIFQICKRKIKIREKYAENVIYGKNKHF